MMLTACLRAQSTADVDKAAIQHAKNLVASSLDGRLPKVTRAFLLNYEAGGAPVTWRICDCKEEAGMPARGVQTESPLCVEADFDLNDKTTVSVVISLGNPSAEPTPIPALVRATVRNMGVPIRTFHRLGDLPMELHRPKPRLPQELPLQVGAL
jgi:hypothetical protein